VNTLSGHGVSIDVPAGWDVRIFRRPPRPPETTHAIVHAGDFALPEGRGDYGDGAVQQMGEDDVLIALVEFHPDSVGTALFAAAGPPPLGAGDASPTTLQRALGGQSGIQRFFTAAGRAWSLYVVIGSHQRRHRLVPRAARFLARVRIDPHRWS
jgi:hypothetical protein